MAYTGRNYGLFQIKLYTNKTEAVQKQINLGSYLEIETSIGIPV